MHLGLDLTNIQESMGYTLESLPKSKILEGMVNRLRHLNSSNNLHYKEYRYLLQFQKMFRQDNSDK